MIHISVFSLLINDLFDFKEQSEGTDIMLKLRIRTERLCWLGLHSTNIRVRHSKKIHKRSVGLRDDLNKNLNNSVSWQQYFQVGKRDIRKTLTTTTVSFHLKCSPLAKWKNAVLTGTGDKWKSVMFSVTPTASLRCLQYRKQNQHYHHISVWHFKAFLYEGAGDKCRGGVMCTITPLLWFQKLISPLNIVSVKNY